MTSPTQLTLAKLREDGYLAEVVEKYVRTGKGGFRKDLFGFLDIVGLKGTETLGVQCTSRAHVRNRVNKIEHEDHAVALAALREAGWTIQVLGWDKKDGHWRCKTVDCS